ncbi:MAG: helix-turn-helix domain-containing protein, partial [Aquihabitans sp.]
MVTKLSLRERHAVETRQRIVDVALALFLQHGYEATTTDEIAEQADVSPRTFFRYFATKEALLFHD